MTVATSNQTPSRAVLDASINGRYRIVRHLGQGGMGSVILAEDLLDGNRQVALKRVRANDSDAGTIAVLRNEFLVLATLRHPGLARVHDFGKDLATGDYFFTSEFVNGSELLDACDKLSLVRPDDLAAFFRLVVQVLRALEYIHSRGLVHGDVKPANILVTEMCGDTIDADADPVAKLIDFGLTKREKDFGGRRLVGTAYYIAPETVLGSQVDRRTDLYAFGAVLYRVVTGRVPFPGKSKLAVLKGHMSGVPLLPSDLMPGIPRGLNDFIVRLLQKNPSQRYQSALEAIEALNSSCGTSFPLETPETALSYVEAPRFEGREKYFTTLYKLFHCTCRIDADEFEKEELELPRFTTRRAAAYQAHWLPSFPKGRLAVIRGEKGIGKRSFVLESKILAQTRGAMYMSVLCGDEDGGQQCAFGLLLDEICRFCPAAEEHEAMRFAREVVQNRGSGEPLPESTYAAFTGLVYYLLETSCKKPAVLHFDQLDQAGSLTTAFLATLVEVQAAEVVAENRFLTTATISEEHLDVEGEVAALLTRPDWKEYYLEVRLERLNRAEVSAMLGFLFPGHQLPGAFIRQIAATSDGNPQVITQLCRHCLAEGLIVRTVDGWILKGDPTKVELPGKVRQGLKAKIMDLDPKALKLAIAFAFLGHETELELAARFARVAAGEGEKLLGSLLKARILRSHGLGYSFVYTSARDILYGLVPSEELGSFHNRAGMICKEFYAETGRENPQKVAMHFLQAGNVEEGTKAGLAAAEIHTQNNRLHAALETYTQVEELVRDGSPDLVHRIGYWIVRLHVQVGDYRHARDKLLDLEKSCVADGTFPDPVQIQVQLARVYAVLGDFEAADARLAKAKSLDPNPGESNWKPAVYYVRAFLRFFQGRYQESLSHCEVARSLKARIETPQELAELHMLVAENYFALGDKLRAVGECVKVLNILDAQADPQSRVATLYCLGKLYKVKDKFSLARNQFRFCAKLRGKIGARDGQADALTEVGGIELFLGETAEATEVLKRAVVLYEGCGNRVGLIKALNLLAEAHRRQGQYEDANVALERALRLAKEVGNTLSVSEALFVLAKISLDGGHLERAIGYLSAAYPGEPTEPKVLLKLLEFNCQLYHMRGDFWRLLQDASRGLQIAKDNRLSFYVGRFLEWLVKVHVRLGNLTEAEEFALELRKAAQRYHSPLGQGRALFIEALVFTAQGKTRRATTHYSRAEGIFTERKSERDLLSLYYHYGLLLLEVDQLEQAFFCFEEGNYLAKKLKVSYWKAQLAYARGLLELKSEDADAERAAKHFEEAERYAERAPYAELLSRIRTRLATCRK